MKPDAQKRTPSSLQQTRSHCNRDDELGRRDSVAGEMLKNKPPCRVARNKAASEVAWHCKHWTRRGVVKFYESVATLSQDMGDLVPILEETIEAHGQAPLKTAQDPGGGPFPA